MRLIYIVLCIFMSVLIVLLFGATYLLYDEVLKVMRERRKERRRDKID